MTPAPCPYCGKEPQVYAEQPSLRRAEVQCRNNDDHVLRVLAATTADAVAQWNRSMKR